MIRKHTLLYNLILLFFICTASASVDDFTSMSQITLDVIPNSNSVIHITSDDLAIPAKMWAVMDQNGNDTRIFAVDDVTEFPFWIENMDGADDYSIWINVTDNSTGNLINWYFGNDTVTSASDGYSTFLFFDDFEDDSYTDKWDVVSGTWVESGGILSQTDEGVAAYLNTKAETGENVIVGGSILRSGGDANAEVGIGTAQTIVDVRLSSGAQKSEIWDVSGLRSSVSFTNYPSVWYDMKYQLIGSSSSAWIDGVLKHNGVTVTKTGTNIVRLHVYHSSAQYDDIFVRVYNVTEPSTTLITIIQIENAIPDIPTLIYPTDNLMYTGYPPVELNVSSYDADGDVITFYYYGDVVDGSTFLGLNDTVNGTTFNWSTTKEYNTYFWKAQAYDGYNESECSDVYSFTVLSPPNQTLPTNGSTQYETYPPLTATVSFYWEDLSSPQYRIVVAEDESFNILVVDTHVVTNNSNHALLVNKEYFWKLYSHDGTAYSDVSDIYSFNLTSNSTLTGSAIEGVVYQSNGDITAISGAEVTIWNTTWSSSMITGSNGYYLFEDLNAGTVYNLQAKSDRYWDSSIALVNASSDPVTNNFYLIDDLTDTEWWHYVEFTVQNVWGVTYPDVATNVYIGVSPTAYESGTTESDGTISFHLDQNVQYRITFINSTHGIDEDITLYPVSTSYKVYIDSYSFDIPTVVTDDIQAYIVSSRINATYGYINFTWSDTSDLTTSIDYFISDVDGNVLYSTSTSSSDLFDSQVVTATDDRYIVRYIGIHPTHGTIDKTETIVFHGGRRVDLGWPSDWQYAVTALAFLIFFGALFGAKTAQYGGVTVVMLAWFFKWIGWLDNSNTSTLLLILATVIAFGWVLRKSEEVKT